MRSSDAPSNTVSDKIPIAVVKVLSRILRDQQKFLDLYRCSLSNVLKRAIDLRLTSIDRLDYSRVEDVITSKSCIGIISSEDVSCIGMLMFDARLAHAIVEYYLGGIEHDFSLIETRELTHIDLFILKKIMDLAIDDLNRAQSSDSCLRLNSIGLDITPEIVSELQQYDRFTSVSIKIDIQGISGTMMLVVLTCDTVDIEQRYLDWGKILREHLQVIDVHVSVRFEASSISLEDLVELRPGDILPLKQAVKEEVDILVENVPKFKGFIAHKNGNRVVNISRVLDCLCGEVTLI